MGDFILKKGLDNVFSNEFSILGLQATWMMPDMLFWAILYFKTSPHLHPTTDPTFHLHGISNTQVK